jgi:adenine deaminase
MEPLEELIAAARGEIEVDLLLEGAEIANTLSGEVYRADVAIHRGRIAGFCCTIARNVLELQGSVIAPGFIDGHVHLESAMVTIPEYARAVVPKGTTSVVMDPHEIANVLGLEGILYMMDSSRKVPLNVYLTLSSCVPATHLETSGAELNADDLAELMGHERVLGLAEVMNYPGVINRDPEVLKKIRLAAGKRVDGHAPQLRGSDLAAYIAAGITSDHECITVAEAREKLRQGMYIMIREGSAAKNLLDLLPLVTPKNARQFLFVSDDRHPADILQQGHLDFMLKAAVAEGLDPILALQIASLNPAQYFGLRDLGAIAPGYRADLAVLEDLEGFAVKMVLKDGQPVAEEGVLTAPLPKAAAFTLHAMRVAPLHASSFDILAQSGRARVIGVVPDQVITRSLVLLPKVAGGMVVADTERDLLKIAVVERHRASGNVGLGLVQGFGLQEGAIVTSVAHDSHNLVVVGTDSEEMLTAVTAVRGIGGGLIVVAGGRIKACLALPVAGLLSQMYMRDVAEKIEETIEAARELGCRLNDPFMTLSFLSRSVIPELKLTDRGLVDVRKFAHVPLFCDDEPGRDNAPPREISQS